MSEQLTGRLPGPDRVESPMPDSQNRDWVESGIKHPLCYGDGSGFSEGGLGSCKRASFLFSLFSKLLVQLHTVVKRRRSSLMPLTARYGLQSCHRSLFSTFPSETTSHFETHRVGRSASPVIPFIPFYLYI